jgi:hypothetical protein
VLANLGVEVRYALSAPAKGRVKRLWGVLLDRFISLRRVKASTRGRRQHAERVLPYAQPARFAGPAHDAQPVWRQAPSDHSKLLDLCALHFARRVHKNHTVRIHGRVIDIPKRHKSMYATYAGTDVVVTLLSGDYLRTRLPLGDSVELRLLRRGMHRVGCRLTTESIDGKQPNNDK